MKRRDRFLKRPDARQEFKDVIGFFTVLDKMVLTAGTVCDNESLSRCVYNPIYKLIGQGRGCGG